MINTEDFIKRLQTLLQHYGLTASAFADSLDVQRSSVSHIMSGRNKPSLDFVLKILHAYPEVNLQWLLNGKGNFPAETNQGQQLSLENQTGSSPHILTSAEEKQNPAPQKISKQFISNISEDGQIEQIVIFYKNGQFKIYKNLN